MSIASPHPDVQIPDASVFDYLFGGLGDDDLDRPALTDTVSGQTVTYRGLVSRILGCAGGLHRCGVTPGAVIALYLTNSAEFVIVFHGALRAGATVSPINALATSGEVARQLRASGATHLVTVTALLPQAAAAAAEVGIPAERLIVLDGPGGSSGSPNATELFDPTQPAPQVSIDPATAIAVLPFSSGTTGAPKGVMLTHRNLVANSCQIAPLQRLDPTDVMLAVLPFFHIYGLTVLLHAALRARANLVIMPRFELSAFLANISAHGVTHAAIAPPIALALAKHPDLGPFDTSTLRVLMSGAAALDEQVSRAVARRLGVRVVQSYGMTELSPASHMVPFDADRVPRGTDAPLSSCGWVVPNGECKLVDLGTGGEIGLPAAGLSAPGELCFRGPNVMAGYLDNAAATTESVDADGFLHTGDIARVDADGCFYIVDRIKELIKYKGYQVPPGELEALLLGHAAIADAAVVGVAGPDGEEIPKAFVVRSDSTLTAAAVMDYVAARVAPYKRIRQVEFIDAVPKSPTGKILRRTLRA